MTEKKYELLSPAGDWECLEAAVKNGADAVYIGERSFSARKSAANFSWEEIGRAAEYCREYGVKLYLALNTLIKEAELKSAARAVENAARNGIDALIIQDLGLGEISKKICPDMPIHASTQLTAHSPEDVRCLMKRGFSRVVLSRELKMEEIRRVYEETGCEIEAFVHGALCVCFSGLCLMSSFIGGRSGNRGCCAQPCRRKYSADGRSGYFLSPKDLSLCGKIEEMKRCGVVSFKIEGRMKSPEYVGTATHVCRKAVDGEEITPEDNELLRQIFSRGGSFTEGYFSGLNTPEIMNYYISNDNISASAPKEALAHARELCRDGGKGRSGVKCVFTAREGEEVSLYAEDGEGNRSFSRGNLPRRAVKAPLTAEKAAESICKTGGTPFFAEEFTADIGEGLFVPSSELNALRRSCFEELCRMRRETAPKKIYEFHIEAKSASKNTDLPKIIAFVRTAGQMEAAKKADKIVVPIELAEYAPKGCGFRLPPVILDGEAVKKRLALLPKGSEVYSSSPGGLELILQAGLIPKGDQGLNVYNSIAAEAWEGIAASVTMSPELSLNEIKEILRRISIPGEIAVYGRQEVMVSRACLIKGVRGRCGCGEPLILRDKTGAEFPVLGDRETHLNTVLNSRVTYTADRLEALRSCRASALQLRFTLESPEETAKIIDEYRFGGVAPREFTRGYFFK